MLASWLNWQRILNFYSSRNLASDELFFTSFIKFATAPDF
ncbi:hypothetical protein HMPREF3221_02070 [Fusobacterium nucleatum]|uniref:Riboflavin synthase subunit alpha n=1 Tax=Fusobacterium nucleatum TaxID=851 RepID=A0A133NIU9_FUSNU|nr:hypothetical protein HMPREF3221_02070 [Fusobacterium nucleatum]